VSRARLLTGNSATAEASGLVAEKARDYFMTESDTPFTPFTPTRHKNGDNEAARTQDAAMWPHMPVPSLTGTGFYLAHWGVLLTPPELAAPDTKAQNHSLMSKRYVYNSLTLSCRD
jgi:hypothetical protein